MRPDWTKPKYDKTKIDLSNNICYDTVLIKSINEFLKNNEIDVRQYSDEYFFYERISLFHNVDMKNIAVGYGLGELIQRILFVFRNKTIDIVHPTWPMVEIFCKIQNIKHRLINDITGEGEVLYLANPNGVSGVSIPKQHILDACKKYEFVVLDEAYSDFDTDNNSLLPAVSSIENLIILKTFSKSLAVAGLRLGYAISNRHTINDLQLIRPSCVSSSIGVGLSGMLFDNLHGHVERMLETREWLEQRFDCQSSQGNFVLFKTIPESIKKKFFTKNLGDVDRMALTNLDLIKDALAD